MPWREKDRQEAGLEQQNVPLKTEKGLPGDGKREIKNKQRDETEHLGNFKNEQQRQNNPAAAKQMKKGVA